MSATKPIVLPPREMWGRLTAREQEVARLYAEGRSAREVGKLLFRSFRTINHHVENIYDKLDFRGVRPQCACLLARFMERHGLFAAVLIMIVGTGVIAQPTAGVRVTATGLVAQAPQASWALAQVWGDYSASGAVFPEFPEDCGSPSGFTMPERFRLSAEGRMVMTQPCMLGWLVQGPQGASYDLIAWGGPGDFDCDGDLGTDADIEAFFACLGAPGCAGADFDDDGASATDADIECFFRVLGGGTC